LAMYDGDLTDYARWLRKNQSGAPPMVADASAPNPAPGGRGVGPTEDKSQNKSLTESETSPRRLSYKDKRELEQLPTRIEKLEQAQHALHEQLAEPGFYQRGGDLAAKVRGELTEVERSLEHAFRRWSELE